MHQLPGRRPPRWLKTVSAIVLSAVATVWMLALLPFLLLAALILVILMVPVLQRFRKELDSTVSELDARMETISDEAVSKVDVTPWHRQLLNIWHKQSGEIFAGWGVGASKSVDRKSK